MIQQDMETNMNGLFQKKNQTGVGWMRINLKIMKIL